MIHYAPRQRSFTAQSTSSTNLALGEELKSLIDRLLKDRSQESESEIILSIPEKTETLHRICQTLIDAPHQGQAQDAFRHHNGFQALLSILSSIASVYTSESVVEGSVEGLHNVFKAALGALSESLKDHSGNRRYLMRRVENGGWSALEKIIQHMSSVFLGNGPEKKRNTDRFFGVLYAFALGDETAGDMLVSLRTYLQTNTEAADIGKSGTSSGQSESVVPLIQGRLHDTLGSSVYWQNPEIIPGIMTFLLQQARSNDLEQAADETAFLPAFAAFCYLATSSHHNLASVHSQGVLTLILPELARPSTSSSFKPMVRSLAEALVALGINTLDDAYFLYRHASTYPAVADFLRRALKVSRSPAYIHFDLSLHGYASVELSDLGHIFPPSSPSAGYTLSVWMRIEEFDSNSHTTVFGAFDASQTCFVLIYIEKDTQNLILQTSITSSKPSVRFKAMRFETNQWYHVCIVHKRPRTTSSSRASLFVNGEFVEQVKSQYPSDPPASRSSARFPAYTTPSTNGQNTIQAFLGTPQDLASRMGRGVVSSRWSLASAHLFTEILSDDLIAVHYQLGPRYNGNFQDCLGSFLTYEASAALNLRNETLHPGSVDKSDIVLAIRHKATGLLPESRIILNVAPAAVFNDKDRFNFERSRLLTSMSKPATKVLQDVNRSSGTTVIINGAVPAINDAMTKPEGVAVLTGDPVVVIPQSLDDASWRIGGCASVGLKLVELAMSCQSLLRSVEILFNTIGGNWRNSEAMERESGFGILAALLSSKTGIGRQTFHTVSGNLGELKSSAEEREKLVYELLNLILAFVGYDAANPQDSTINNPLAYRILLIDLDLWRQATLPVQRLYYKQFVIFGVDCKNHNFNAKRLSRMHIVKKMLDPLKGETFSPESFDCFINAFRSIVSYNISAETLRALSLFVTYAIQKIPELAAMPSRVKSTRTRHSEVESLRRSSLSTSSSSTTLAHADRKDGLSRAELGLRILKMYSSLLCADKGTTNIEKFARTVTNKWLLYLLAVDDSRVVMLSAKILARMLIVHGHNYVKKFADKTGGFVVMRHHLKRWWKVPTTWMICFAILFGQDPVEIDFEHSFTLSNLLDTFAVNAKIKVVYPEVLPVITAMLQNGLKIVVDNQHGTESPVQGRRNGDSSLRTNPHPKSSNVHTRSLSSGTGLSSIDYVQYSEGHPEEGASTLHTVCQFLANVHTQSQDFRDAAVASNYVQELVFILYPVIVGSDLLTPDVELHSRNSALSFGGNDVVIRPLSQAQTQLAPIVRTTTVEPPPSPMNPRAHPIRRGSSFVLISSDRPHYDPSQARLSSVMSAKTTTHSPVTVSNTIVEELLELIIAIFSDQLLDRKDFPGFGLFMKVPPGFQEHQAYFETYVLRNTLSQLGNTIQLDQKLLWEPKVLTNLSRLMTHLGEALYEGWFLSGVEPVLNFAGAIIEYLQRAEVAKLKSVRLCSQSVSAMKTVVLRVVLLRLSELGDSSDEEEIIAFMDRMSYWQTVLLSPEESQGDFLRLLCYLLYTKLVSEHPKVRVAAASLWRVILVQKPEDTSKILNQALTADQKYLSTGFRRLTGLDNEAFIYWVDDHRPELDAFFFGTMSNFWERFVREENRRTEETAKVRVARRREKLQNWLSDDLAKEDILRRHEVAAAHWMANIYASEHTKYQRALQDQQDNSNYIASIYAKQTRNLQRPAGLLDDEMMQKWRLDQTEGRNRMRLRVLRDSTAQESNFQPKRKHSEAASKPRPSLSVQIQPVSSTDAVLAPSAPRCAGLKENGLDVSPSDVVSSHPTELGEHEEEFELVDDPREVVQGYEDKNRKVMRTLQRGDQVEHVNNVSRIIGLEACEGLLILGKNFLYLLDDFFQRSDGEIVNVWQAPPEERDPYLQMTSGRKSADLKQQAQRSEQRTRSWQWEDVISISKRRFLFRDVAIELFFTDGRSYLLTTNSPLLRNELNLKLIGKAPHVSGVASLVRPEDSWRLEALKSVEDAPQTFGSKFTNVFNQGSINPATKKWIKGEMSNFHYLMLINTMAGRTFNDLTQYPVFPWVLADYSSAELDLDDPDTFRDLSKPMGCQTASRQAEFRDRYQSFAEMGDQNSPPFHYGTHYSSAMIVTSYLIRLQPFVQSYLLLQGGSFDHPDRLFYSIEQTWKSAARDNMTDVRELTPEFFYLPEFLTNLNAYNFGLRQGSGEPIDTVTLPPWANGDPKIFIAKHREALESPHVSKHLHQWIDLVFGHKQRGEAAIEATNVFHYLSYHGAKDLDNIEDPLERLATIGIIHNFGQTPHQVFQRAHLPREDVHHRYKRLDTAVESLTRVPFPFPENHERVEALVLSTKLERLLISPPLKVNVPPDYTKYMEWGFFDGSVRFYAPDSKKLIGLFEHLHQGQLSCATFADSRTMITAGIDCTISVWAVMSSAKSIDLQPKGCLFGHRKPVTVLALSRAFSVIISASTDGQVYYWDLNRLDLVRRLSSGEPVQCARINDITGDVMVCRGNRVAIYTLNGELLLDQDVCVEGDDYVVSCAFYEGTGNEWLERSILFTGHKRGCVNVWSKVIQDGKFMLKLVKRLNHADPSSEEGLNVNSAITCILPMAQTVYTGDEDGRVYQWDCIQRH